MPRLQNRDSRIVPLIPALMQRGTTPAPEEPEMTDRSFVALNTAALPSMQALTPAASQELTAAIADDMAASLRAVTVDGDVVMPFQTPIERATVRASPRSHGGQVRMRGSRASRRPSPRRLKPRTARAMATPGTMAAQGASCRKP